MSPPWSEMDMLDGLHRHFQRPCRAWRMLQPDRAEGTSGPQREYNRQRQLASRPYQDVILSWSLMRWSVDGGRRVMAENKQTLTITDLSELSSHSSISAALRTSIYTSGPRCFNEPHLGSPLRLLSGDKLPLPVACS